jgi:hypothetical protein
MYSDANALRPSGGTGRRKMLKAVIKAKKRKK